MKDYWVSVDYATGRIRVDDKEIIIETPPIWSRWRGRVFNDFLLAHRYNETRYREMKCK